MIHMRSRTRTRSTATATSLSSHAGGQAILTGEGLSYGPQTMYVDSRTVRLPRRRSGPSGGGHRFAMTNPTGERRMPSSVRLTLAGELGHDIDGAWWPRTDNIGGELPELVAVLTSRLGEIIDIKVNWSSVAAPPKLDSYGWEGRRHHVMTINGHSARAKLLIVPYRTSTALAVMVLRRAADLAINPAHRVTRAFRIADSIVRAAVAESAFHFAVSPVSPPARVTKC